MPHMEIISMNTERDPGREQETTPAAPRSTTGREEAPRPRPRQTKQRQLISRMLENQSRFRTAQQLHADLRAAGDSASLATVYRVLQSLAEHGEVDTWRTPGGELAFRHCSPTHHHHLICYRCGRTVEIDAGPAEQWASRVAAENGFIHAEHQVEVYGLCPQCAAEIGEGH
ncbi:Ferric-uptake regulator [Propionibacterium freudenreichii subsp. freudenreichii]|nr:transcriptional repressor [Propionibacterium freudenreichii]CEP26770.1 Ferric-uptake regulator [Propionibacterium freudenreichii subsp. freudenreichii]MCT2988203.1 transcriptional repressor [Propionibacterium freudenreichii]MCT3015973.1 transcriptional repressor [Propionibacterium freudenreichii]MDK9298417.1 transcriptional repressor [Propionibacterium freudenreichii]